MIVDDDVILSIKSKNIPNRNLFSRLHEIQNIFSTAIKYLAWLHHHPYRTYCQLATQSYSILFEGHCLMAISAWFRQFSSFLTKPDTSCKCLLLYDTLFLRAQLEVLLRILCPVSLIVTPAKLRSWYHWPFHSSDSQVYRH